MHRRLSVVATIAAVLLLIVAGPASAATTAAGTATAAAADLSLFSQLELVLGASGATASDAPEVTATGTGFNQAEQTASEISTTSGTARDPASGQNCLTPDLGVTGLTLGATCSSAEGDAAVPSATGNAVIGDVGVNGSAVTALVDALVAVIEEPIVQAIDDATAELGGAAGTVVEPVAEQLQEQCAGALSQLTGPLFTALTPLVDELENAAPDETAPIIGQIDDLLTTLGEALPNSCTALVNLITTPPQIADILTNVREALAAALADQNLLTLDLGDTTSSVKAESGKMVSTATATSTGIVTPSLSFLTGVVDAIVQELVQGLIDDLESEVAGLDNIDLPTLQEVLGPVLEALGLPDILTSDDPLLSIEILPANASAILGTDGEVSVEAAAAAITVAISDAFGALLGEENTSFTVDVGQSQTFFADTPLESTIAAGAVEEFALAADNTDSGVAQKGVRTSALELALFTGIEGGVTLSVSAVEATAGGAPVTTGSSGEPGAPTLPQTGGGLALLGLLSLGGSWLLRRR